jgi:molybdate transport system permease protein
MSLFSASDFDAIRLSIQVALVATAVSLPFAYAVAYVMTYGRFRGKLALDVIVNLPLTLPPVVIGYILLLALAQRGPIARYVLQPLGIRLLFTWKAAVLATAIVGFPLMVRSIRLGMESVDQHLVHAARSLGAGRFDAMATVILPLSARGVLAGSALMFARGLGEFGATIIVAGNIPGVTQTIPLAIYDYASSPSGDRVAMALCAVSILISVFVLLGHEYLGRRIARKD